MNEEKIIQLFWESFAKLDFSKEEVPSFTMIFQNSEVLSTSSNLVEINKNTNEHSEILAINFALKKQKKKYLENAILVTTLEPCMMCAGAIVLARIREVWYFAEQTKQLGISSIKLENIYKLNHFPKLKWIQDEKIELIWKDFFLKLRNQNKK